MAQVPLPSARSRNWASLCHLSGLVIISSIPFSNVLAPLILYLIYKDEDPFIASAGRESLNFQIFITILSVILFVVYIAVFFENIFSVINISPDAQPHFPSIILWMAPSFLILGLFDIVSVTIAASKANKGTVYRYPITLRFVR
jgi:uncharacterized protein